MNKVRKKGKNIEYKKSKIKKYIYKKKIKKYIYKKKKKKIYIYIYTKNA
jgi:hypothetical protein